jgi:hypothetical protein
MLPYIAVSGAFLAVAILIGMSILAHNLSTARLYAAPLSTEQGFTTIVAATAGQNGYPVDPADANAVKQRVVIADYVRDATDAAHKYHGEVTFWCIAIVVLLFVLVGAAFWRRAWAGVSLF